MPLGLDGGLEIVERLLEPVGHVGERVDGVGEPGDELAVAELVELVRKGVSGIVLRAQ